MVPGAAALFAVVGAAALGMGLLSTASSLRLHAAGLPTWTIGLVASSYYAGIAAGCLLCAPLSARLGTKRSLAVATAVLLTAASGQALAGPIATWVAVRLLAGLGVAMLMGVTESWLGSLSSGRARGKHLSLYVAVVQGGVLVSQLSITAVDVRSGAALALPMLMFGLALVPLAAMRLEKTEGATGSFSLRLLRRNAPIGLLGTFASGVVVSSLLVLTPVFGMQVGLPPRLLAMVLAAFVLGGVLLPVPVGRAADLLDRRVVIALAALGLALSSGCATFLCQGRVFGLAALAVVIGGLGASIYPVAVAHANDELPREQQGGAAGTLLLSWAIGSVIGPVLASLAMQRFGPIGLFAFVCGASIALSGASVTLLARQR